MSTKVPKGGLIFPLPLVEEDKKENWTLTGGREEKEEKHN